ncbi:MAG: alginate export family protein, partial [Verrucomicrobiota bacterium]
MAQTTNLHSSSGEQRTVGITTLNSFTSSELLAAAKSVLGPPASDAGYTFNSLPFTPRRGLRTDVASGDGNPQDPNLGLLKRSFRGSCFAETDLIG